MRICLGIAATALAITTIAAGPALGVVNTVTGTVTAQVQEWESGTVVNSDYAFKSLNETTLNLPLVVNAKLTRSDGSRQVAGGAANMTFSDPRLSEGPDPNEFGVDLAAFSVSPTIGYTGSCSSTETRTIVFTAEEISSTDGTALQAQSHFFVDGVILLWSESGQTDLSQTEAGFLLNIDQVRTGQDTGTNVLSAGLRLMGQSDGSAAVVTSGLVTAQNVVSIDLSGQVPDLAAVHLIIIPNIAIPYQYAASVGETFTLNARVDSDMRSQPKAGAAVLLGVPLVEVASLVNTLSGGNAGDQFQQIVQGALSSGTAPAKPLVAAQKGTTVTVQQNIQTPLGVCGAMGAETALAAAAAALLLARRR